MEWMPQAIREGIFTILFISGPLVILAAGLGLTVGIIQAATQVQEQTLGSAVKIIGLFLAIIIFGFYMFGYLRNYATENISRAFRLVPQLGDYIMPRKNFLEVPRDEEVLNPLEAPTSLNSPPPKNIKSPRLADDLAIPDIEEIKKDSPEGNIGLPEMQRKKIGDSNVIKQNQDGSPVKEEAPKNIESPKPIPQNTPAKVQTKPKATIPNKPAAVIEPVRTAPVIKEETKPARKPRKSLTDSLNKLKDSIDEFNEYNKELEGAAN